jgi:hypothetical protein
MTSPDLVSVLERHGWQGHVPASGAELSALEAVFGPLPPEYEALLRHSNGGSLAGFKTPLIVFHTTEVLALHREHDLYEAVPRSLIFGGDGGGTVYLFDLRGPARPVLFLREDRLRYDAVVFEAAGLGEVVDRIVRGEKLN